MPCSITSGSGGGGLMSAEFSSGLLNSNSNTETSICNLQVDAGTWSKGILVIFNTRLNANGAASDKGGFKIYAGTDANFANNTQVATTGDFSSATGAAGGTDSSADLMQSGAGAMACWIDDSTISPSVHNHIDLTFQNLNGTLQGGVTAYTALYF